MELIVLTANPEDCPACPIVKMHIRRLARRNKIPFKTFTEVAIEELEEKVKFIATKFGSWYINASVDGTYAEIIPLPQVLVKEDNEEKYYYIFGMPIFLEEMLDDILIERLQAIASAKTKDEREELSRKWLEMDVCDLDTTTEVFDIMIPIVILRPKFCRKQIEEYKSKLSDEDKKVVDDLIRKVEAMYKLRKEYESKAG